MFDILSSANDIQKFIDNKMEQSENDNSSNISHGQKLDEKMSGKRSRPSTDEQSDEGGNQTIGSQFNADLNVNNSGSKMKSRYFTKAPKTNVGSGSQAGSKKRPNRGA